MTPPIVGVLTLQGDFALHAELLSGLGVDVRRVRRPEELEGCQALVIPGGESTTLTKLLRFSGLDAALPPFADTHPLLGTCAGCILMASRLEDAAGVEPLGLLDITVRRNGFGTQVDSFDDTITSDDSELRQASEPRLTGSFIRAPRITAVADGVEVWGTWEGEPVAVRQGPHAALTFHPEVVGDARWHRAWLRRAGLG